MKHFNNVDFYLKFAVCLMVKWKLQLELLTKVFLEPWGNWKDVSYIPSVFLSYPTFFTLE